MTDPGKDQQFMQHALRLARRAEAEGEVPVGAIVVRAEQVVGQGWNRNIGLNDPSAHAEILALRDAGAKSGNHRLTGCTLFVTLEPCGMCVGASIHARVERLVFGAHDPKTGALGGHYDFQDLASHNHRIEVLGGVLEEECSGRLLRFFRSRRRPADVR
jgi:tRNA(adenine34) deaminase